MTLADVHLRDLRYFVAVAEHLHFTRAAEALYVSQPALSKQIHALEAQLRAALFERDRRTVRLTAAGAALLPGARAVLSAWAAAEAEVAAALARQAAALVVGMSTGVGRSLLPAVRARFAAAAPEAELRLRQVPWSDPTGGLAATGEAASDAAFVWLPLPDQERFAYAPVATEDRLVALAAAHPLAARARIAFADLLDEPFLALPPESGPLRDFWLALDERGGRAPRIGGEVSTSEETAESVAAGLGVVLLAAGNAALLQRPDIALRPVTLPPARLVLAWRAGDDRPLLRALRTAVAQATGTA
ncbi:LysR substrate-binding domain-containing protein [Asanoa sp. NPDC050611]|uniref:LysR substrate-binding domain-containing protein n=1 Tax=Asanoa sp. NPDC050611 TaxID=3157098 RepID=UPI00340FAD97